MRRRFALVFNARAGIARPRLLRDVLGQLQASGAVITPLITTSADDAAAQVREIAREGGFDAVIAAGGDGTIRAVARGAAGTELPVGIIPLGTGNVMCYEIGLTPRPRMIATTLLSGPQIPVEGGTVNGAPFYLMVGAGFDGRIVGALNHRTKRLLGRLAYGGPIMRTLWAGPDRLQVTVDDGAPLSASWVIVSNASRYGGSFTLTPQTTIAAPGLVAVIVTGGTRRALLKASLALALGRLADKDKLPEGIRAVPCRRVLITSQNPVPVEIDGDEGGTTPLTIEAGGAPVRFIVPAAYVAASTFRHTNRVSSQM